VTDIAVAADAAGERFTLEFQVAAGSWQCETLSSCHGTRFEEALPARPFRFEKGLQSFAGWWYFATTAAHVGFESWLERDLIRTLRRVVIVAGCDWDRLLSVSAK
jgi:hypothetical protein